MLDLPATASVEETIARLKELHGPYREDYQGYYDRNATPTSSPAIRGADPLIVLVPGVGMFSFGKDKQTARVAGEFYVNAINVMRGAEGLSTYAPIDEAEKFRIEYWALEEAKLQRMPKPKPLATRIALVTGAASGIGKAIATKLAAEGACVVIADLSLEKAQAAAAEIGGPDVAVGVQVDVSDEAAVQAMVDATVLAFGGLDLVVNNAGLSLSKSLLDTTVADWDLQHDVMAKGSFLVSRAAAKVLIDQELGGDIVYISSKNSVFAGPNNIAYSAVKADQAHQVRLLAAELGEHGIKVNGVNPDGVVPRLRHLRRRLGRRAGGRLRRGGEGPRQVLRPAHPAQARGAARALRPGGLRALLPRADAHHRPARARRLRRRGGLPQMTGRFAAVDLGASSGRVMVGEVGPDTLRLTAAARFPNDPVRTDDGLHWDIEALFDHAVAGLAKAYAEGPLTTIGVDSWAVDYGRLRDGRLIGQPFHYRDERRTAEGPAAVAALIGAEELYRRNGLQYLPFNTLYQLAADTGLAEADALLLIPDLVATSLAGNHVTERTNASTTGLLDVTTREWDTELMLRLGLDPTLFSDLVDPGDVVGDLLPHVADQVGGMVPVVAVGSHDTASAVVGVPMQTDDAAYVSLGTWALAGLELDAPVLTEEAGLANFTNEGGVDGTIRFLTNVMGTWLLSETLRTWGEPDLAGMLRAAAHTTARFRSSTCRTSASCHPETCRPGSRPGAPSTT